MFKKLFSKIFGNARQADDTSRSVYVTEFLEGRTYFATQWGLFPRLIDQDIATSSFPNVTGAGTTIAILDSGVNYNNPILGGGFGAGHKVVDGFDFVDNDSDPMDPDGHGTGVAAIAAGNAWTYGGNVYRGIAPGARIVALRIDDGTGNISDARYEAALQWVLDHRAEYNIVSVNISEGGTSVFNFKTTQNSGYFDELAELKAHDVLVAVSSGNDGLTLGAGVEYPAADPSAYAIGATDSNDHVWSLTSRGNTLDLLAPGVNVPTPWLNDGQNIILQATGTSFATPYVAGMAALLRQIDNDLTPDDIMGILEQTGRTISDSSTGLSFPRLNVANALSSALGSTGQSTVTLGSVGADNDMAFASDGRLWLTYYDSGSGTLKVITRDSGGTWSSSVTTVDSNGNVGRNPSIAVDKSGHVGISYYDLTNQDLKYAFFDGSTWSRVRLDTTGNVGQFSSTTFDPSGDAAVSYYSATNHDLKVARFTGTAWTKKIVDAAGDSGKTSSIAWNKSKKVFAVAYENHTTGQLKFAQQKVTGSSTWAIGVADKAKLGGRDISLAFDSKSQPSFSYYDVANANLRFVLQKSGVWKAATVASTGTQGISSRLFYDGAGANIVYFNQTQGKIMLAFGGLTKWTFGTLLTNTTSLFASALGAQDQLDFTYLQQNSSATHLSDVP